jgi:signal transduction histidine kinase
MDITKLASYLDVVLLFAGAVALLVVLYYYQTIARLQKNVLSEKRNILLLLASGVLLFSYLLFGYRLLSRQGIFQSNFASGEDTFASVLFFSGAIFVLYASQIFRNSFLKIDREFAAIFKNISAGIHTVNADGVVDFASPSFVKLCASTGTKDVVGKPLSKVALYHDKGYDVAMRNAFQNHKGLSMDIPVVFEDGEPIKYYRVIATPMDDTGDVKPGRTLVFVEDVTEQRLLDQAKNDFISIASHEMRTPLTIIRGNASLIRDDLAAVPNNIEMLSMASSIEGGSVRLMKIVNDFLDVIRLEDGVARLNLKMEIFDLVPIIQKVTADLQDLATKKDLTLTFRAPAVPVPLVQGDGERTEQVLINLTMNAIQYTDKGTITLSVETEGQYITCKVTDTGVGIDKESQQNLFNKFGTANRTFVRSKEYGSGLGLYICKLITDAMKGHVQLESSEPGVGSTFSFSLLVANTTA